MCVLPECMSVYHIHAWCLKRAEEGIWSYGTGVIVMSHYVGPGRWTVVSALNHWAISPAPSVNVLIKVQLGLNHPYTRTFDPAIQFPLLGFLILCSNKIPIRPMLHLTDPFFKPPWYLDSWCLIFPLCLFLLLLGASVMGQSRSQDSLFSFIMF